MELLQLKYFCDAARCENFSKTAAKFGVPPAGVSQSVKRLEKELGVKLFDRRANSLMLSEEGRVFYEKAGEALRLLEEGKNTAAEQKNGGQIKILASSVRRIVMQTVEKFRHAYPNVEIIMSCTANDSAEDFDVLITSADVARAFEAVEEIVSERMVIAMHRSHPLASREHLSVRDIQNEAFIAMGKGSNLSNFCEKLCMQLGFEPRISIRCDDPFYVRRCVELSLGIAIVPELSWRGLYSEELVLRPFCDSVRKSIAYVNKNRRGGKNARAFVRLLKAEGERELGCMRDGN